MLDVLNQTLEDALLLFLREGLIIYRIVYECNVGDTITIVGDTTTIVGDTTTIVGDTTTIVGDTTMLLCNV